jgi:hypothetical protein
VLANDNPGLKFEAKINLIAWRPFSAKSEIAVSFRLGLDWPAVYLHGRLPAPGRRTELEGERGGPGGRDGDVDAFVARVSGIRRECYAGAIVELELGRVGVVKVHDRAICVSRDRKGRNEGDSARSARKATMAIEIAAVGLLAFHLNVITPGRAIAALSAQQLIEDGALELFGKAGFARQAQQLRIKLQPGHRHAGLAHIAKIRQIKIAMEKLAVTRRARQV